MANPASQGGVRRNVVLFEGDWFLFTHIPPGLQPNPNRHNLLRACAAQAFLARGMSTPGHTILHEKKGNINRLGANTGVDDFAHKHTFRIPI